MQVSDSGHDAETFEEDLFCLHCGYNLRGLCGDPCRCPECGSDNDLSSLRMPAKVLAEKLRRLETMPTWCVAAAWAGAVGGLITWPGGMLCGVVLFVPAPIVWVFAGHGFGKACAFRRGWLGILAWYHLAGMIPLVVAVLAWFASDAVLTFASGAPARFGDTAVGMIAVAIGSLSYYFPRGRDRGQEFKGIYGLAKHKLDVFCREYAVDLANPETPSAPARAD